MLFYIRTRNCIYEEENGFYLHNFNQNTKQAMKIIKKFTKKIKNKISQKKIIEFKNKIHRKLTKIFIKNY